MKSSNNALILTVTVLAVAGLCACASAESFERTVRRDTNRNQPMIIEENPGYVRPGTPVVTQEPGTTAIVEEGRDMSMVVDEPEDAVGAQQLTNSNNNW